MGGWSNETRDNMEWDGDMNVTGPIADYLINGVSISTSLADLSTIALNELTDVNTTGVASGDFIQFNGSDWVDFDLFAANNTWEGTNDFNSQVNLLNWTLTDSTFNGSTTTTVSGGNITNIITLQGLRRINLDGDLGFLDFSGAFFGSSLDASISYDNTNLVINPQEIGSGNCQIVGIVDVLDGSDGMLIGADNSLNVRTDATVKIGRFTAPHFSLAQANVMCMSCNMGLVNNTIDWGGGHNSRNAATKQNFRIADTNSTTGTGDNMFTLATNLININPDDHDANIQFSTQNILRTLYIDGGRDEVEIGANTNLSSFFSINGQSDKIQFKVQGNGTQNTSLMVAEQSDGTDVFTLSNDGVGVFLGDVSVSDEAYGSGWNASVEVPTKNAVFDKIESATFSAAYLSQTTTADGTSSAVEFDCWDSDNYSTFTKTDNVASVGMSFSAASGRFIMSHAGTYVITHSWLNTVSAISLNEHIIQVNDADVYNHQIRTHSGVDPSIHTVSIIKTLSADDYLNFRIENITSTNTTAMQDGTTCSIHRIS